jgi:prolyl 4-hydroxylase
MEAPYPEFDGFEIDNLNYQPLIFRIKKFLTEEESEYMINCAKPRLRPCNEISAGVNRTGWGLFLREGEEKQPIIAGILEKMKKFVPVTGECEVMQIIR